MWDIVRDLAGCAQRWTRLRIRFALDFSRRPTMANTKEEPLMTTLELAKRLRVTPRTITLWAQLEKIPCIRISAKEYRYKWSQIAKALNIAE